MNLSNKITDFRESVRKDIFLYALLLLPITFFVVFKYVPMLGIMLAFRQWSPGGPIYGSKFRGLYYFEAFLTDPTFWRAFKNNIVLSLLNLLIGFPFPIVFALLLEEVHNVPFKKTVQTVSYLPRFISVVVVVGLIHEFLSPSQGILNILIANFGIEPIHFLALPQWFRPIYISSEIWQWMGWHAIIYIAALANVDISLYENAAVEGAGRFKQVIHISIHQIMPAIVITLILRIGHILSIGFEKILLLENPLVRDKSEVIATYVFRLGILGGHYSFATAIGFFGSLFGLLLIFTTNWLARKYSETSLW